MFKRSTKITSLLVAAASVATMVPAMAADKIADKDGTIYRAVSYKDGKLYIDGKDIQDAKDEDGVFYLDNGKSTEVDSDIDSGDEITAIYGEKYLEIEDGDYYLDLSNGKVTDDSIRNDDREDAASELRKKIRKDDPSRYDETVRENVAEVDVDTDAEIWEVPAAPYSTPYYQVSYLKFASDKAGDVVNRTATVYTDAKGNYIDADNDLGKVNVLINKNINKDTTAQAISWVDPKERVSETESLQFDEVGTKTNKDKTAEVGLTIEHERTLAADKDYVYRLASLHVSYTNLEAYNAAKKAAVDSSTVKKEDYTYKITTDDAVAFFGSTKNPVAVKSSEDGKFYVIQKISKASDGDKDDAKLPKTTATYFTSENKDWRKKAKFNEDGSVKDGLVTTSDDGDRNVAFAEDFDTTYGEKFTDRKDNGIGYTVVDGKITKYQTSFESLNDNGSAKNDEKDKFVVKTFSLKNSNGYYYIDSDTNDDDFDDEDEFATAVDSEGNIWKLDSGKIYKYKNDGDYELMYKCDGGLNELSVYDDKNLVAYNEDDDVYAIVGGKSSTGKYDTTDDATDDTTTTAAAGLVQDATTGAWSYTKADGTKAIGWFQSPTSGLWYYMDANGVMQANGWIQDGGSWYFLDASGAMKTGWVYTGGAWYFLKNTAGNLGAMQTGWIQTGGKWYYCNASGAMLSNTTVGGYVLGADGAWIK